MTAPAEQAAERRATTVEYHASLRRHFWHRVAPTLISSGLVIGVCGTDVYRFTTTGEAILHPILASFFILCAASLALVALVATWSITRRTSLWSDE